MASNAGFLKDISQNKGMNITKTTTTAQQLSEAINGNVLRDVFLNGEWGKEKPIFKDVFEGNIKNIQEYLKKSRNRIDIKSVVCNGLSLFQIAILGGNLEVVKLLINSQREKLKAFTNDEQNMAILTALDHKYEDIARFLIEQGVYARGSSFQSKLTPLMLAVTNGYSEIVEQMVSKNLIRKSDINAANSKGDTALMMAAKCGSSNSSYSTAIEKTPVHFDKLSREYREVSKKPILDPTTEQTLSVGSAALETSNSVHSHYEKIVEILLKKEADPLQCNRNGRNALMCAAIGGSVKIVQLLLNIDDVKKHIDDISKELFTASWYSLIEKHEAIFFLLRKAGADPNVLGKGFKVSPLCWAMNLTNNIQVFEIFLGKKFDINEGDNEGDTALHKAAGLRWEEGIKFFIKKGAFPNARNKTGETPLHQVVCFDHLLNSTKLLVEYGADVNLANSNGGTPLIFAATYNASNNVKELIKASANLYIQDNTGKTALMVASEFGNLEVVQELISEMEMQGKMEVDTQDNYGRNALFCATYSANKNPEILRLLLSKSSFDINREFFIEGVEKSDPKKVITYSLLNNAIYFNNDMAVEFMLANGANILYRNSNNISGLKIAIALNRPNFVMLLLKGLQNKLDENRDGVIKEFTDAIYLAAEKDRHEILKMLLSFLLSLEKNIESQEQIVLNCFRNACAYKSKNVIHSLLSDKNIFLILNRFANDLLLEAVYYNVQIMVEVLLGNSFDVNINYKNNGQNFLFIAIRKQFPEIVSLLLDKGINITDHGETQVAYVDIQNEAPLLVTPIMFASRLLIKLDMPGAATYTENVFDLQIAILILSKMIWNELKDNYIKDLLLKCPRGEALKTANDIKAKIQVFSEKVLGLNILFDIKNDIYFLVDSEIQSSHRFALLPEVFKSIYEIQKNKGSFNYKDFMQYIVKYDNNLGEKLKKEKKHALYLVNTKKTQLLSKIGSNAATGRFPKIPKPLVLKLNELSEKEIVENNQMLIFLLITEIERSNLFLGSDLASDKFDENRLAKLKQVNEGSMSRIQNRIQEFNDSIKKLKDLQERYTGRYLEISKEINQQLEVQGIEAAEKSLETLNSDPVLAKLLTDAERQEARIKELSEEFSKIKEALTLQRDRETRWELSHQEKLDQLKRNAIEYERLNQTEKDLAKKAENDKRRLEAKLEDEANELKRRKEKQALEKEKRRAYAVSQEEERKRKNEKGSELFSNPQTNTMDLVPKEPKEIQESLRVKENEERRKRHFPLTMTIASKSNLSFLISLSPEAIILKEILNEIEILIAHDFLGSNADKLGARKACLGMMARITEIAFNNEGSIFPALHAEHFRDVIWHAKNEFIDSFSDEEIFSLTKIMAQYVLSVLKNGKETTSKALLSLKQNKIYNAILEHDLRLKHEPFDYSYYEAERKLEKDQEAQLKDCIVLSPVQLEHARGHSVGRIGGIIRRIQTYYYAQYKENQENYDNDLTADRLRIDRENYLIPGRKYRHAESLALDTLITQLHSTKQSTKEIESKQSAEQNSSTTPSVSTQLSGNSAFLPQYNKSGQAPKVQDTEQNEPTVRFTINTNKPNKKTKSKRK